MPRRNRNLSSSYRSGGISRYRALGAQPGMRNLARSPFKPSSRGTRK